MKNLLFFLTLISALSCLSIQDNKTQFTEYSSFIVESVGENQSRIVPVDITETASDIKISFSELELRLEKNKEMFVSLKDTFYPHNEVEISDVILIKEKDKIIKFLEKYNEGFLRQLKRDIFMEKEEGTKDKLFSALSLERDIYEKCQKSSYIIVLVSMNYNKEFNPICL